MSLSCLELLFLSLSPLSFSFGRARHKKEEEEEEEEERKRRRQRQRCRRRRRRDGPRRRRRQPTTTTTTLTTTKKKKTRERRSASSSSSSKDVVSFLRRHVVLPVSDVLNAIASMNYRQLTLQLLSLTLIVTSALMIWKSLPHPRHSESPVVVVLSGSMEPAFKRGDILFLSLNKKKGFEEEFHRERRIRRRKNESGRNHSLLHRRKRHSNRTQSH